MVFPCKERELEVTSHSLQAQRIMKPVAAHWTRPDDLNIRISRQGPIGDYTYPGDIFFNGSTTPKMLVWIEGLLTASWGLEGLCHCWFRVSRTCMIMYVEVAANQGW
ncbi:hypothetical protein CGLO_04890 [Colletotrichum gloeosporioides Cg-14]|uniref:Uncharacterized protein n=1 Tax=Colletotrichum gloeosporioides (strain Cg-14) TaxID=1237896 RepID=T0KSY2_COLGC|nr:hypothetical protein CGLO_04890 [Colletotrichum gloeosporioides Cg-14]